MSERLCSVGLDVGTTTTQLIVSELTVENRSSGFAIPELEITGRRILYKSPVHFTPLQNESLVDGAAIRDIVEKEYEHAGISRESVDTGAIIITGESSRKENAQTVLNALSSFAGQFVVATAGPDLESVLAAKGAGAVEYSQQTGKTVLHMDIGGGTSNLALICDGKIQATGCMNVGGRLLKFDPEGRVSYISPVLRNLTAVQAGDVPLQEELDRIAAMLAQALEMAAGLREKTALFDLLTTKEAAGIIQIPGTDPVISFSGGVADCIEQQHPPQAFGDMGPALGRAIQSSRLCEKQYILGAETIRATVIGAGCHSAQLSGSTVFYRNVELPAKNLPVAAFTRQQQDGQDLAAQIKRRLSAFDAQNVVLAMPGYAAPSYEQVTQLADRIAAGMAGRPVYVSLEADMAKALGHSLQLRLPPDTPLLCIDRVRLGDDSFLDVGTPVGPALPVVIKTLVLSKER